MAHSATQLVHVTQPLDASPKRHDSALAALNTLATELQRLVDDKGDVTNVTLCALLSCGHILLEDVPGVGKTTFIKAMAKLLGLEMARVQFTSDLLPSDIIGVEVYDNAAQKFCFHNGPIFTQILLADELNRASPRTQSALLEAMSEGHVTVDNQTHELPKPFIVFAAQNPLESIGTYELPESQLDRFAAKLKMGYPSEDRELSIFQNAVNNPLESVPSRVMIQEDLSILRAVLENIHISEAIARYAKRYIDRTRSASELRLGVSTRGGVIWLRMARALAMLRGRKFVTPDDLQALAVPCLAHRIIAQNEGAAETVIRNLLTQVDIA